MTPLLYRALSRCVLLICGALAPAFPQAAGAGVVDRGAHDPAVSPDGKTLAVGILGRLWLLPIDGGDARQLTFDSAWHSHPAWFADGRFLAYAVQRRTGTELVVRTLGTGMERTLYETKFSIGQIAYRPKHSELAFVEERGMFEAHLWSVPTSIRPAPGGSGTDDLGKRSAEPKQLTFGDEQGEWSFAFSPEGDRLALEHVNKPYPSGREVHLLSMDGTLAERLTDTHSDESSLNWTRDGASLVYVDLDEGVEHITVRSMLDGATRRVFSSAYDSKQLALHPDGKTAVMVAGRRLFRVDLASGRATAIPFRARVQGAASPPGALLIKNARVFVGTGEHAQERTNVLVQEGRIVRVWRGDVPRVAGALTVVIDARGRFLMPGLMDNHFHYWRSNALFRGADLLAMGITSIRDPGAQLAESLNLRDAIAQGVLTGPRIYSLGPLLDGYPYKRTVDVPLTQPQSAAALVRSLHQQGVDGLKLYFSLAPEVSAAVIAEAKTLGLPVNGDIIRTSWKQAISAGIQGLSHADSYRYGFIASALQPKWNEDSPMISFRKLVALSNARIDPKRVEVQALLHEMATHGVMLDPTLVAYIKEDSALARRGLDTLSAERKRYEDMKAVTLDAYRAGVRLLAGTDNGSLPQELELYEQLGLPNATILQAATLNGARWLGKEQEFGSIEPGKRADLLLVAGDPLQQMKDIRNVELVVKDGRIVFEN